MTALAAGPDRSAVRSARDAADTAAARAGVVVEQAHTPEDLGGISAVIDAVWHPAPGGEPLSPLILRALEHTGNYCAVARLGGRVVGACVGFLAVEPSGCLHSHLAGVTAGVAGRHVGFALKLDQRAWALERAIRTIEWTFDPLVRRNAFFNCVKLGARATAYLSDFYGVMHDRTNAGQGSDRLVATWELLGSNVFRAATGEHPAEIAADLLARAETLLALDEVGQEPVIGPQPGAGTHAVLVRIPEDISAVRQLDPGRALRWRYAVRDTLTGLLSGGWTLDGMTRDGCYVLHRRR